MRTETGKPTDKKFRDSNLIFIYSNVGHQHVKLDFDVCDANAIASHN